MFFSIRRVVPSEIGFECFRLEWIQTASGDFDQEGFRPVSPVEVVDFRTLRPKEKPPTAKFPRFVCILGHRAFHAPAQLNEL